MEIELIDNENLLGRGQGQGVGGPRQGEGGAEYCKCPDCSYKVKHGRGTPCNTLKCPKCNVPLVGA